MKETISIERMCGSSTSHERMRSTKEYKESIVSRGTTEEDESS